jgi:hypothetical protein
MCWLMKHWWFWGGMGFILVALVTGYFLIPVSEGGINRSKFDRIQLGMREWQVKDVLGPDVLPAECDYVHFANGMTISGTINWCDEDGNGIICRLPRKPRGWEGIFPFAPVIP